MAGHQRKLVTREGKVRIFEKRDDTQLKHSSRRRAEVDVVGCIARVCKVDSGHVVALRNGSHFEIFNNPCRSIF
jgi:hypothetical protein